MANGNVTGTCKYLCGHRNRKLIPVIRKASAAPREREREKFPGHWLFRHWWRVNEKIHYLTLIKAYYAHYQHKGSALSTSSHLPPFFCTTARHMATALNVSKSRKSVPVCESVWQHNYHPHCFNYTGRKKKVYMRKQEVSNNKNH